MPYPPNYHVERRQEVLLEFIRQTGMAAIVTVGRAGFEVTNLPLLAGGGGDQLVLTGHMPRVNPQSRRNGAKCVAIFQGPQAYVSPGWYLTKKTHPRTVPTWDYITVRVHGEIEVDPDPQVIYRHVDCLSAHYEQPFEEPWHISDAPDSFITQLVKALVVVRIKVSRLEGIWKIHQNHPLENRLGVAHGLRTVGSGSALALADAIEHRESEQTSSPPEQSE
jgi:transcriptional regulator